jgi:hypothetical protein
MNLSLRTNGKSKAAEVADVLVPPLMRLIEHDNMLIRTYIHGIVYALSEVPSLRERFRAMGFHELLKHLKAASPEVLVKQIDYILSRLNKSTCLRSGFAH